ncbi:MAG: 2-oxoglutarate dehydrogenase complex dihydrolipoyllysine-residue succinyltransferase [Firmicutes bacterium]|nr:2-oxoglutarate dehydrogenase complex dihydrolipoyllysine-residue succinyltransferase [Bacillota bacterium]
MPTIVVPELGESITEATLGRWLKQPGELVAMGEPVAELETDKVNLEVTAPASGRLAKQIHQEGDTVQPGEVLGELEPADVPTAPAEPPAGTAPPPTQGPIPAPRATPDVRRLAKEYGVDLKAAPAHRGRVTHEDLERLAAERAEPSTPAPGAATPTTPATAAPNPPVEAPGQGGPVVRERLSRRRLTIARRLVAAQHEAAMLTTFNQVDLSRIQEIRRRRQAQFEARHGVRLGLMSFFTKAAVGALKAFPRLNAEIDLERGELILKQYYDIGIAVATEGGLVVPVVRAADRLTFAGIEREIARLAEAARSGRLSLDDLAGGTFTITNGGVFGSLFSTPILNPPQVGILGMHAIEERPVAVDGQVVIRPMMYLALTYDHRVVDGAEAVQFLRRIKELLEDPESLLLEG